MLHCARDILLYWGCVLYQECVLYGGCVLYKGYSTVMKLEMYPVLDSAMCPDLLYKGCSTVLGRCPAVGLLTCVMRLEMYPVLEDRVMCPGVLYEGCCTV